VSRPGEAASEEGGAARDNAAELRARSLRATPQRRAILAAFEGGPSEHLSAEEIHARASSRVEGLGRGTVYATLADLAEVGLLAAVGDQEPIRYESNTDPHAHFRCGLCVRLFDVTIRAPSVAALAAKGYLVEAVTIVAEGVCSDCQAYADGLRDGARAVKDDRQVGADLLEQLACVRHESALGTLLIGATPDGIARVVFDGHADFDAFADRARSRRGGRGGRERAEHAIAAIDAFLSGERAQADDVVDWGLLANAAQHTLEATRRIAWGQRRSYHAVSERGLAPYDCGYAMGSNPMPFLLPCHRVTRGHETPADYVGGPVMRKRLEHLERA
jgi:Fur family ferric uptake transcriptional regulator